MKVFGTDGLRDSIDGPLLQPVFLQRFTRAVANWAKSRQPNKQGRLHAIIGRDTRQSGQSLFLQISNVLADEQIGVFDAGVCPTPAVAMAVRDLDLELGIAITASHNPATDNGIKLFGPGGAKLSDAAELDIESRFPPEGSLQVLPNAPARQYDARRHYLQAYKGILPHGSLMGMKIVVDASNGATYQTTAEHLSELGAAVERLSHHPDGQNINLECGSEHPQRLQKAVCASGADLGIAHDGDGDRLVLCDASGQLLDGDTILAILATQWAKAGLLPNRGIVSTIMSNCGLDTALANEGIRLHRAGVGDRQVFFKMRELGLALGGESSGHIISTHHLPTGDGLLAALLVLRCMIDSGKPLADLASIYTPFPQLLRNLKVSDKPDLEDIPHLQNGLRSLSGDLGQRGRVLLRYSGTEPKIRLLVEADSTDLANRTMQDLHALVHQTLPVA